MGFAAAHCCSYCFELIRCGFLVDCWITFLYTDSGRILLSSLFGSYLSPFYLQKHPIFEKYLCWPMVSPQYYDDFQVFGPEQRQSNHIVSLNCFPKCLLYLWKQPKIEIHYIDLCLISSHFCVFLGPSLSAAATWAVSVQAFSQDFFCSGHTNSAWYGILSENIFCLWNRRYSQVQDLLSRRNWHQMAQHSSQHADFCFSWRNCRLFMNLTVNYWQPYSRRSPAAHHFFRLNQWKRHFISFSFRRNFAAFATIHS